MLLLTYFAYNEKSSIYLGICQLLHIFFFYFISLLQLSFSFSYSCIFQFLLHHVDIFPSSVDCMFVYYIYPKKKKQKKNCFYPKQNVAKKVAFWLYTGSRAQFKGLYFHVPTSIRFKELWPMHVPDILFLNEFPLTCFPWEMTRLKYSLKKNFL